MRVNIGTKLIGGFMTVAVLTLLLGIFAIAQLHSVNGLTRDMGLNWLPSTATIGRTNIALGDIQRMTLRVLLERDPGVLASVKKAHGAAKASFEKDLGLYEPAIDTAQERTLFEELKTAYRDYSSVNAQVMELALTNRTAEAAALNKQSGLPAFEAIRGRLADLRQIDQDAGAAAMRQAEADFNLTLRVTIGLLAVVLLTAVGIGLFLTRMITRGLAEVSKAAERMAAGHLDTQVTLVSNDELGDMAESFRAMILNLRQIIAQVRGAADSVASGAEQIGAGTEQLAQSSQVQAAAAEETSSSMEEMAASFQQVAGNAQALAANVEETSSSIEEMAASIQQVAGNAETLSSAVNETSASIEQMMASIGQVAQNVEKAGKSAETATGAAEGGRTAVMQTVEGMKRINQVMGGIVGVIEGLGKSSAEIGAIIEVIDDIAEQTNLLALNAAIEAARAGDAGRGFAVVADEVRKLAERSAKATGEIGKLIRGVQREAGQAIESTQLGEAAIHEGTQLAERAGSALQEIVAAVGDASAQLDAIQRATQEQTHASTQISKAVGHMSSLTEQVSSASREQAKGSEQILQAVGTMTRMTHQVSEATVEQRKGGDQVLQAVENVNRSSQESASATQQISQSVSVLTDQANRLLEAIAYFKDVDASRPDREVSRTLPAQRLLAAAR